MTNIICRNIIGYSNIIVMDFHNIAIKDNHIENIAIVITTAAKIAKFPKMIRNFSAVKILITKTRSYLNLL